MSKKQVSVITLVVFVLTSTSCTMIRTADLTKADYPGKSARIMSLVMNSGVPVVFSGSGRIRGDTITGMAIVGIEERIPAPPTSIKKHPDGTIYEIIDRTGRAHSVLGVLNEGETEWTIVASGSTVQPVSIPLSEVKQVKYKKINTGLTILAIAPVAALGLIILGAVIYYKNI